MEDIKVCPNCSTKVKGFFASGHMLSQNKVDFINKYHIEKKDSYCSVCSTPILHKINSTLNEKKNELNNRLKTIIKFLPIISSEAPINWEYEVIEMVSTQQTSGTGFATELSRSWNDFFGTGSNATNKKIYNATELCKTDLRIQCAMLGGNAVISADIDFNEIGSGSTNMLMVCMAGTAVQIKNLNNANIRNYEYLSEIIEISEQLDIINNKVDEKNIALNS